MSLQLRLTLGFLLLLAVLAAAAFWGLNALTNDMRRALGETVSEVGHSLIAVLREERVSAEGKQVLRRQWLQKTPPAEGEAAVDAMPPGPGDSEMRVVLNGRELSAEEIAALPEGQLPGLRTINFKGGEGEREEVHIELQGDTRAGPSSLFVHGPGMQGRAIPIPDSAADAAIGRFRERLLWGLLLLLLAGGVLASLLARRVVAPIRALGAAATRVGQGELGEQVQPGGPPEVRRSIAAFNRMAQDLQRLQAETESLRADRELAELGEIGRGLAHSLRNPLHALGLSLDALADGGDAERGAQLAASGREQLARIDQALRGFLALSASAGASAEPVAIDEVIADVLLEASQRAQGRVRFAHARSGQQLLAVAAELRIILHALLINALEASPEGGGVGVEVSADGNDLCVLIDDQGPGLSAEVRARLFQPHTSSKPSGAGMGLYLAERLARLRYRGAIEFSDREGGGTRATLRLKARETPGSGGQSND